MKRALPVVACALLLQGCALVLLAGGGAAGVAGADYMQTSDRTFTASMDQVHAATDQALAQMNLKPTQDATTAEGRKIVAQGTNRTIDIDLKTVAANTTSMTVQVKTYSGLLRDGATADEVVQKTTDLLASAAPIPSSAPSSYAPPAPPPADTSLDAPPAGAVAPTAPPPGPTAPIDSAPLPPAH
jgi:hypothetical protein